MADEPNDEASDDSETLVAIQQTGAPEQPVPAAEGNDPEVPLDVNDIIEGLLEELPVPIADSAWFQSFVALVSVLNVAAIGLEQEFGCLECGLEPGVCDETSKWKCTKGDPLEFRDHRWLYTDIGFTFAFVLDIVVAVASRGPATYFKGSDDPNANVLAVRVALDNLVVSLRVVDLLLNLAGFAFPLKLLTAVRIYKLYGLGQGLKRRSGFKELYLIMSEIHNVIKTVAWVFVLLALVVWAFACVMTELVGKNDRVSEVKYGDGQSTSTALEHWGTVPRSVYTLCRVATLDKWSTAIAEPVIRIFPLVSLVFYIFLCVASLALLNLVVGNIVQNSLRSAKANDTEKELEKKDLNARVLASLRHIFDAAVTYNPTKLEMQDVIKITKTKHVKDRLKMVGLPPKDLRTLFLLLEADDQGRIPKDVFYRACVKLRGEAAASDMWYMKMQQQRNIATVATVNDLAVDLNVDLASLVISLDGLDRDIIKVPSDELDEVMCARRARVLTLPISGSRTSEEEKDKRSKSKQSNSSKQSEKRALVRSKSMALALLDVPEEQQHDDDQEYTALENEPPIHPYKMPMPPLPPALLNVLENGTSEEMGRLPWM